MRYSLFIKTACLTAGVSSLLLSPAGAIEFPSATGQGNIEYMDDRSSPQAVIASFYNAINSRQYPRAYSYYEGGVAPADYSKWAQGFAQTAHVRVITGSTQPSPGAGQIYWSLPVAIEATQKDGHKQVFAGCYQFHMANPGMITSPPYSPIAIQKGNLKPVTKPLDQALPTQCDPL
ncbi:hypothetical protein [Polycladidibacter stylochi]|uniref:hypothetical protein n=1 Tax=Polycladidibacter stylochi TaxID=1807766 RepID=UPI0008308D33|nr:hypothetical protein [Pseudovibrio stylochi]